MSDLLKSFQVSVFLPNTCHVKYFTGGYDPTFTNSDQELDVDFLNTVKRGANLPVKFGSTRYRTNRYQLDIPENGPTLALGYTKAAGERTARLVVARNGTGRVTLLQSSLPSLAHGSLDYITTYNDIDYANVFKAALKCKDGETNPLTHYLTQLEPTKLLVFEHHRVIEITSSVSGVEWFKVRFGFATSTWGYDVFDRDRNAYTAEQIVFLEEDIGMQLKTTNDLEEEESW